MTKQGLIVQVGLYIVMSLIWGSPGIVWAENGSATQKIASRTKQSYSAAECDSLANLLVGQWINKAYLDELVRTKSPQKALGKLTDIGEFRIVRMDENTLFLRGTDFHLSVEQEIELIPNDSMKFSGVFIDVTKPNTLYYSTYKSVPAEMTEYVRVPDLDECVNDVLVTGEYYDVDNPGNKLIFRTDGVVTGLENYEDIEYVSITKDVHFHIMIDSFGSEHDRVLIGTSKETGSRACYIFEIDGDTLLIFDSYKRYGFRDYKGELTYRLKRVN